MKKPLGKRKMQKRRKKEKEEKRKIQMQQTAVNIKYNNNNKNHQQTLRNKVNMTTTTAQNHSQHIYNNQQHIPYPQYKNPINSYTAGMRQWWQTYCTAIQYHNEQARHWEALGASEQAENETETEAELLQRYAAEYDTSSDEEDVEDEQHVDSINHERCDQQIAHHVEEKEEQQEEIDLEYLKFLEITHRHREELRLKRLADESNE